MRYHATIDPCKSSQYPGVVSFVPCIQLMIVNAVVYVIMQTPKATSAKSAIFCHRRVETVR